MLNKRKAFLKRADVGIGPYKGIRSCFVGADAHIRQMISACCRIAARASFYLRLWPLPRMRVLYRNRTS